MARRSSAMRNDDFKPDPEADRPYQEEADGEDEAKHDRNSGVEAEPPERCQGDEHQPGDEDDPDDTGCDQLGEGEIKQRGEETLW